MLDYKDELFQKQNDQRMLTVLGNIKKNLKKNEWGREVGKMKELFLLEI